MGQAPRGFPPVGRCLVMGVVNVTPDSFSDGGEHFDPEKAVQHGLALAAEGADLVDVGGESTRPGALRVDEAEERRRVVPVVRELAAAGVRVSVDTMRAGVAEAAVAAGAVLVNDVSGGLADEDVVRFVAAAGVPYVVMHWRGHSERMYANAVYDDVVADVRAELAARLDRVTALGVAPDQVILDPGIGFAKRDHHSWTLLARLDALATLGRPVLVGASRKGFLGRFLADADGHPRPMSGREDATAAISALAAARGAWCVRVHDVRPTVDAVRVAAAMAPAGLPVSGRAPAQPDADRSWGGPRDRIVLRGLRVRGRHGVFAHEKEDGQTFVVDATLETDVRAAARSDDLADTADYGALADRLAAIVAGEPADLIETVAERLVTACLDLDGVHAAEVTLHKPEAPIAHAFSDVAVTVRRERPDG